MSNDRWNYHQEQTYGQRDARELEARNGLHKRIAELEQERDILFEALRQMVDIQAMPPENPMTPEQQNSLHAVLSLTGHTCHVVRAEIGLASIRGAVDAKRAMDYINAAVEAKKGK